VTTSPQLDLLSPPPARPRTVRSSDPETSRRAAERAETRVAKKRDVCIDLVRIAFAAEPTLTAKEAERRVKARRPEIEANTVRCRFSQLAKLGEIVPTGAEREGCRVFTLASRVKGEG
jgi:hypothetical protein